MSRQMPRRTLYRFEYPETGTEHILRRESDRGQKTLEYPGTTEFYATSVCGMASVHLREGDLEEMSATLEPDEAVGLCASCIEHSHVFVKETTP